MSTSIWATRASNRSRSPLAGTIEGEYSTTTNEVHFFNVTVNWKL